MGQAEVRKDQGSEVGMSLVCWKQHGPGRQRARGWAGGGVEDDVRGREGSEVTKGPLLETWLL